MEVATLIMIYLTYSVDDVAILRAQTQFGIPAEHVEDARGERWQNTNSEDWQQMHATPALMIYDGEIWHGPYRITGSDTLASVMGRVKSSASSNGGGPRAEL